MANQTDDDFGNPLSPEKGSAHSRRKDQLDLAGQANLSLLEKTAGAAEENNRRVVETAQKFSGKLRAAENRIAELENRNAQLEAENQIYREKSERAEEWLRRIYSEIQDNVLITVEDSGTGSIRAISTASSSRSLQRNPTGWAWGCRFAGRSSLIMAGVWRWPTVSPMDRSLMYFYRSENALA